MSICEQRSSQIEIEVKDLAPATSSNVETLPAQESGAFDGDDGSD
ncbi:MAG: hypothetical protein SWY16_06020 [Cyanobacteriota bacterium]|nr:hypothetical protein [Cyanobacteriota bacterium]